MKKIFLALAFLCLTGFDAFATRPDPDATPGKLCTPDNPDFVGYRYAAHVAYCKRNVSQDKKAQVAEYYGIPKSKWKNYEFDHLIPLNSGGSSDIENLWPEPLDEAHEKDKVEQQAFDGLKSGELTQDEAVQLIFDWIDEH